MRAELHKIRKLRWNWKEAKAQFEVMRIVVGRKWDVVAQLRGSIRERTGLPSSAGLQPLVSELQLSRETLQQEEAAAAGRRAGLEAAIARWTDRAKASLTDDALIKELNLVVQKTELDVKRKEQLIQTHSVSQGEYDDAIAQLAIDKAKVITAQQRVAHTSNETTDAWNRELMNLNIASQERAARLKYIEGRLKDARTSRLTSWMILKMRRPNFTPPSGTFESRGSVTRRASGSFQTLHPND